MSRRAYKQTHVYTVSGQGPFPFDMLRYDRCWPRTGEDAATVTRAASYTRVAVDVEMEGLSEPTVDRWRSFGWRVEQ